MGNGEHLDEKSATTTPALISLLDHMEAVLVSQGFSEVQIAERCELVARWFDVSESPSRSGTLNAIAAEAWGCARDAGWHSKKATHVERLALIHSEVSEALEAWRRHGDEDWVSEEGKPEGIASELADIIIRTAELAYWLGIDLDAVVELKQQFNRTRRDVPKHGTVKAI